MELINGVERWQGGNKLLYLALGNFDGVHRGHQVIISGAVDRARAAGGVSAALIFDPHPSLLLRPDPSFALLTDIDDRAALMSELGLDYLIVEPFTERLASLSPEQFVRNILLEKLKVSGTAVGYDYSFGAGGAGCAATMLRLSKHYGFSVDISPAVQINGFAVSSSAVRRLLREGAVRNAAQLLNYYFCRRGKVIKGHGIGTKVVVPTANINVSPRLIWPGKGVYLTAVSGPDKELRFGVTNVGSKPTFREAKMSVETHILDFRGDIYHRELCLYFLERIREIRTFGTPEALKNQVERDIQRGRDLIASGYTHLNEAGGRFKFFCPEGVILQKNSLFGNNI